MSVKQAWLNIPVKDLQKSKEFFKAIGFRSNPMHEQNPHVGSFFIGEKDFVLMLFPEAAFAHIVHNPLSDTAKGKEMLINIDAESREEVDAMAETARNAGGKIFAEPGEAEGWMYVMGFEDLDGHRWAMLHMDMSKMPQQ
ncbi:VOC family protein [Dyadobacter sp. CY312]|uniref:VOC family protein n=1 Tax=Dyadobacter sp. CY312 TaxID=2907303 RepID=UPI001F3F6975|nr:VOC family protein [Dyadobacter sp. CY312]MCE7040160.1 VOC family protein [Dyadobacter sp. CY312]